MPRSKILATYDSPAMFRVVDEAIKAGPAGYLMSFHTPKHANSFMLDFYGFRNAIWVAIERYKREDLSSELTLVSRIRVSKQGSTLVFLDRTGMTGYSPAKEDTFPPKLPPIIEPAVHDNVLSKLGYSVDSEPPGSSNQLPPANTSSKLAAGEQAPDKPLPPPKPKVRP